MTSTLQSLIYDYNNTIVVESTSVDGIFREIEAVRNNSSIDGYIFRPDFASNVEFKEYTDSDYMAIYAQWSLSFGWDDIFEFYTGNNPKNILDDYLKVSPLDSISPLIFEDKAPVVKQLCYLEELTSLFLSSKTVLNSLQKSILENMDIDILKKVFDTIDNIPIHDNKYFVLSLLMDVYDDINPFQEIKDIIPVIIKKYPKKGYYPHPDNEMITSSSLKKIKIKLPTRIKRMIIEKLISELDDLKSEVPSANKDNIKKYNTFWKNLLREISIRNSFKKTIQQYPEFIEIYHIISSKKIRTFKSPVEIYRKNGDLKNAFLSDMKNPGALFRNILFYLRNKKGDLYPVKVGSEPTQTPIKTDVTDVLNSKEFKKFLLKVNPKLLLQVEGLLKDKKYSEYQTFKIIDGYKVNYEKGIPPIYKDFKKQFLKLISKTYKKIKRKENKKFGKVFISDDLKDLKLSYSGRLDTSNNKSGNFLPIGSKIKIDKIIGEDMLLRYGVSWKSPDDNPSLSICIDPSIQILNGRFANRIINWEGENHTLTDNGEIIISSSGDITNCNNNIWSTEFVDINIEALRKAGSTKFFTAILNYDNNSRRGGSLGEVNTHVFFNILKKDDRVLDNRTVSIPLDQMDYSYQVVDNKAQAQIGLLFDLEDKSVEILKISIDEIPTSTTATVLSSKFLELINDRPKLPLLIKKLNKSFYKKQIVNNKDEADLILDKNTDIIILQDILY
jgi:hypothetical protein